MAITNDPDDQKTGMEREKEIPKDELREIAESRGDGGNPKWLEEKDDRNDDRADERKER